ncbi:hypothetical protein FRB98_005380, partial [Tulasnella sp. 332]
MIAQERSIQGHTPLYWTIVKIGSTAASNSNLGSPRSQNTFLRSAEISELPAVFDVLASLPLTLHTYADAIQARTFTSSHIMFKRLLPHSPNPVLRIRGGDETSSGDIITVVNAEDAEGAITRTFRAQALIKDFQRRLYMLHRTEGHITEVRNGSWIVSLELVTNSADTRLDSRLTIGQSKPDLSSKSQPTKSPIVFRMTSASRTQITGDETQKRWDSSRGPRYRLLSDDP